MHDVGQDKVNIWNSCVYPAKQLEIHASCGFRHSWMLFAASSLSLAKLALYAKVLLPQLCAHSHGHVIVPQRAISS